MPNHIIVPKVSVCVMTYNQEKYIRRCLQSIVSQETDFDFEVIVGDDCSTDGTKAIVREFAEKYPGLVRVILHEANIGVIANYFSAHNAARGEYVAHCDGDDYWLPGKLKCQSRYLDDNPDVIQVWHRMLVMDENNCGRVGMPIRSTGKFGKKMDIYDISLSYGLIGQHSSQMYRRKAKCLNGSDKEVIDYYFAMSFARSGNSVILNKVLGVYQVYSSTKSMTSSSVGRTYVDKALINLVDDFSLNQDLKKRLCSHLLFRLILNFYRGRPVAEFWACLKRHKFTISPVYFFSAVAILFAHK